MKGLTLLLSLAIFIAIFGCKRSIHIPDDNLPDNELIMQYKAYFESDSTNTDTTTNPNRTPRFSGGRSPDWAKAGVILAGGFKAVCIPITYVKPTFIRIQGQQTVLYNLNGLAHLLLFKDSTGIFRSEMVTAIPDSDYRPRANSAFKGIVMVDDWHGFVIRRYSTDGKVVRIADPTEGSVVAERIVHPRVSTAFTTGCYEVEGYNYSPSLTGEPESWSESAGCSYGGLSGSGDYSWPLYSAATASGGSYYRPGLYTDANNNVIDGTNMVFVFDSLPSIDLSAYFKCFTYIPDVGAHYSVSICTDLPVNSNPEALASTSLHCGHSFIIMTKSNGNFSTSVSFGFYPLKGPHTIAELPVTSKIVDDGNNYHEYNASLSMVDISNLDFLTLQHESENLAKNMKYDLDDYNCTNYAMDVINSIRPNSPISIPDWIGPLTGINFGKTPNGLYEYIKSMQFNSTGSINVNIKIGTFYAPKSTGPCN